MTKVNACAMNNAEVNYENDNYSAADRGCESKVQYLYSSLRTGVVFVLVLMTFSVQHS